MAFTRTLLTLSTALAFGIAITACGGGSGSSNSASSPVQAPPPAAPALAGNTQLLLQSGFESGINIQADTENSQYAYLRGSDTGFSTHNDWLRDIDNSALAYVGNFRIWYEQGDSSQRFASITNDPTSETNKVLAFDINQANVYDAANPAASKGRVQTSLADNGQLNEIYSSVRLYLHPDLASLKAAEEAISWFTLQEYWNNLPEKTHPFRVSLNLQKAVGAGQDLHFSAHGQTRETVEGKLNWVDTWNTNPVTSFAVPTGEWMTLETYYKEGNADNGRFIVHVTDASGQRHTIADVSNVTRHPNGSNDGVSHFNPMKLYTSGDLIQRLNDANKELIIYWDDFSLWVNGTATP